MKAVRFAAAITCISAVLAMPAMALAGSTTSTTIFVGGRTTTVSKITPTAPSRLTTTTGSTSAGTSAGGQLLPNTGLNLLPETLMGFALVLVGAGLRYRRSRA